MKIKSIKIENYRSFEQYQLDFADEITVLIGKNGAGKTNLITALKKGLSFIFAKKKDFPNKLNSSNGCNIRQFDTWDSRLDDLTKLFCTPINIEYNAEFNNKPLNWSFYKEKSTGHLHSTKYNDALNDVLTFYNDNITSAKLPLLAYYSDSFPHIKSNISDYAKKIIHALVIPRDFGYYTWDDESNCAELWKAKFIKIYNQRERFEREIKDFEKQLIDLQKQQINQRGNTTKLTTKIEKIQETLKRLNEDEKDKNLNTAVEFITNKVTTFTSPLSNDKNFINSDFEIIGLSVNQPQSTKYSEISFRFFDGRTMYFDMLPQGYRRLISIVFDIVIRSFILNGCVEPEGIVLIDEIELHLHPILQQEVLQRFRKTFPKIQFIVSTHSPLVISNFDAVDGVTNKIIKLVFNNSQYENFEIKNIYGIDYNTSLQDIMGVDYRSSEIDNLINSYVILKLRNKNEEAQKVWDKLFEIVGNDNDYIKKEIETKILENS